MAKNSDCAVSRFARTKFRDDGRLFGIKQGDRLSHMYVIGKTGVGKSSLLETLALQDLESARGSARSSDTVGIGVK